MQWIASLYNDRCELEVLECECGFHLGIDASWLYQDIYDPKHIVECPNCKKQKLLIKISKAKLEGI
jgi:hypothetical protein